MVRLIGLMGQKQSGKDTVAAHLVDEYDFTRLAFADELKEFAYDLDPFVSSQGLRLRYLVNTYGWDVVKNQYPEARRFLQELGVIARERVDRDVWVNFVHDRARYLLEHGLRVVITDVRFPNEVALIRRLGGEVVRVERPGLPDSDGHVSEHAWRDVQPDYVIVNDGTIADLQRRVDADLA